MPVFEIDAIDAQRKPWRLYYDSHRSVLMDGEGREIDFGEAEAPAFRDAARVSRDAPGRKERGALRVIKISLGLGCNYSCEYCSQRFVPHASDEGSRQDVSDFLAGLSSWFSGGTDAKGKETRFEFWGGEPFVYWRKLKPLAEALRETYPSASLTIVTNGSLLDAEKNDWLDRIGFRVGISHDGPGQKHRGPDPLSMPAQRAAILDLYRRLKPQGRVSFNAMLHRENLSRSAIRKFFVDLTGDDDVPIGEFALIDAYDADAKALSLQPDEEAAGRRTLMADLAAGAGGHSTVENRIAEFMESLATRRPASALGQKCGMDRSDTIAVDLKGRVVTCQNVSAEATAPNGQPHHIGDVGDWDGIALDTGTHWAFRDECQDCPVLQLCKGSCMFLEGELFEASCRNAYSDNVVIFAHAIHRLTGMLPMRITGPHRRDRHSLWE